MTTPTTARRPSLASDSLYNGLSFSVRAVGTVVGMAWVARALGPEDQGRFGFAHWAGATLAQLALLGIAPATTRFVARALGADRAGEASAIVALTRRWLGRCLAVAVPLGILAAAVFGADLRVALVLAALYPLTLSTYLWRIAVAWGLRRFDIALKGHLVFFALLLPGFALGLASPQPVLGVLIATLAARAGHTAVVWAWTRGLPPAAPAPVPLRREVHRYAWDMAAVTIVGTLLWDRSELAILKAWAPWHEVGLYTAAFGISALVIRVPAVLAIVLVPFVAELQGAAKHSAVGEAFGRGARLLTLALAAPTVVAAVAAPSLVDVIYGADYAGSVLPVQILLLPLALGGFGGAASKTMVGAGEARLLLRIESVAVIAKFALVLALVPGFGAVGAAAGCAVGQAGSLLGAGVLANRKFGAPERGGWLHQIVVVALAAACAWAAGSSPGPSWVILAAQVAAGALGWIAGAALLRPLAPGDVGERWPALQRFERPDRS